LLRLEKHFSVLTDPMLTTRAYFALTLVCRVAKMAIDESAQTSENGQFSIGVTRGAAQTQVAWPTMPDKQSAAQAEALNEFRQIMGFRARTIARTITGKN
jgi:hypothetical protein